MKFNTELRYLDLLIYSGSGHNVRFVGHDEDSRTTARDSRLGEYVRSEDKRRREEVKIDVTLKLSNTSTSFTDFCLKRDKVKDHEADIRPFPYHDPLILHHASIELSCVATKSVRLSERLCV